MIPGLVACFAAAGVFAFLLVKLAGFNRTR